MSHVRSPIGFPVSLVLSSLMAMIVSVVFSPGLYSSDSLNMAYESYFGVFNNLHSTLMPMIVSLLIKCGVPISLVIALQSMAIFFGLRELILGLAALLQFSGKQADMIALLIITLIASPLTLFSLYSVTFWNDIWLVMLMLWLLSFFLKLWQGQEQGWRLGLCLTMLVLISGCLILVRQNALIIYMPIAAAFEVVLRRNGIRLINRFLIVISPFVLVLIFLFYQYYVIGLGNARPERAVYALDLASMIVYDPNICHNLGITSCDFVLNEFPPEFVVGHGAIDLTLNQGGAPHEFFLRLYDYPQLTSEYFILVSSYPYLFLKVKLLNYLDYLRPDMTRYYYQKIMYENYLGLSFNSRLVLERAVWFSATDWFIHNSLFRWFSSAHVPWFVLNIFEFLTCLFLAFRTRQGYYAFFAALLLVPLSYYISYLFALTSSEFRFMYPSTLVVQVITLTLLFAAISRWLPRGTSRLRRLLARPAGLRDPS